MTYADEQFSLVDECNCTAVSFDSTRLGNPLVAQSLEFDRWFDTPRNSKNFSYIQIEFVPIQIIFYSFTLFYDYKNCLILMYNFVYMYIVSYFIHKNNKSSRIFLQSRHASNSKNHLSLSRFPRRTIHPSRCHSHYTPPRCLQMRRRRWETLLEAYARADLESLLQSTRCLPFRSGSKRSA